MNEFHNQVKVLSSVWINYREDEGFQDFIEYNDIGLPLAYFADTGLVTLSEQAMNYVEETYELFVDALGVEDKAYESLEEMLDSIPPE